MTIYLFDDEGTKQFLDMPRRTTYAECKAYAEQLMLTGTWFIPNPTAYDIQL